MMTKGLPSIGADAPNQLTLLVELTCSQSYFEWVSKTQWVERTHVPICHLWWLGILAVIGSEAAHENVSR